MWWLVASVGCVTALAGCPEPGARPCGDGVCPSGLSCVADPLRMGSACTGFEASDGCRLCVLRTCGNGSLDPGETCDDGNNVSGDGCPADCSAACGDGVVDTGEACDDGNHVSGDGCSADCSSSENCGTGTLDPGEQCDDGNLVDGDGCSATCSSEQPTWTQTGTLPPTNVSAAMAYDPVRDRIVLFDVAQDTWEWDGTVWRQRALHEVTLPPPQTRASMAYDAARRKMVLFGESGETWEWDGASWEQQHPATSPSRRTGYAMTYDAAHQKIVLFGGCNNGIGDCAGTNLMADTWEWDGVTWTQVASDGPPARTEHALAFDAARGVVVLFGGWGDGSFGSDAGAAHALADTWEWDGVRWTQRTPASSPSARVSHALAYDSAHGKIVLFGGDTSADHSDPMPGVALQDLWEWDGSTWTERTPALQPPARWSAASAFDTLRGRLLVVGGNDTGGNPVGDIWQWDGNAWSARSGVALLPARTGAAMAYDPNTQRATIFGGMSPSNVPLGDTWQWDGAVWTAHQGPAPSARSGHVIAFDATHGATWLFGGRLADDSVNDETWEWWMGGWVQPTYAHHPSARTNAAVAFDPVRGKLVLFGGQDGSGAALADTWELDGSDWTQRTPTTSPPARFLHGMAFDTSRGKAVLFGGQTGVGISAAALADTWEWDGTNWTQRAPATSPPGLSGLGMIYDAARGTTMIYGGCKLVSGACTVSDDTWSWDGTTWTQLAPAVRPPGRVAHAMTYDTTRGIVVMSGGSNGSSVYQDTWEWNGSNWSVPSGPTQPSARTISVMAYDSVRGRSVLFSGWPMPSDSGTWEWDGERWLQRFSLHTAPARQNAAMAFDSARGRIVVFGGMFDATGRFANDTWEWDGTDWLETLPANQPSTRAVPSMAYDAARGKTVLFGGTGSAGTTADTWLWDGTNWTLATPAASPAARGHAFMAYDAARRVVVLFGGYVDATQFTDTWEWDGTTWAQRGGGGTTPPGGIEGQMIYDAARKRVVFLGGNDTKLDAWEWDGTAWSLLAVDNAPSNRSEFVASYDTAHDQIVLFSGTDNGNTNDETWLFGFTSEQPELVCRTGLVLSGAAVASCTSVDCSGGCATCGDNTCDPVESCRTCPTDCGACDVCGDFLCSTGETCASCPGDCGACP